VGIVSFADFIRSKVSEAETEYTLAHETSLRAEKLLQSVWFVVRRRGSIKTSL
jgi:hypothetical protein